MRVLLDTQVVVMAYLGEALPRKVQILLEDAWTERVLTSISLIEVAIKNEKGALPMAREDVEQAVTDLRLTVIPFTQNHAYRLFGLPAHHHDPFDRMLIATALSEDMPIVSSDRQFKRYRGVRVIW
ncbi:MAG: type II toxin-antitoxin system VapC family toxin [Acidobacteriaceae bacterium]|nr:type II toxin-antitoxin system VapC family toxin [Acidobacteriaceae bacterium]